MNIGQNHDQASQRSDFLSSFWNDDYLNDWTNQINETIDISNSQNSACSQTADFMSSNLLELGSLHNETRNTSIMPFPSDLTRETERGKQNGALFRPWDSSAVTNAISTPTSSLRSANEELTFESPIPVENDIYIGESSNLKTIEKTSNVGSLVAFLKNEGWFLFLETFFLGNFFCCQLFL